MSLLPRENVYAMLLPVFLIKYAIIKFHFDQMFAIQEWQK